jgi:hypothetical protein
MFKHYLFRLIGRILIFAFIIWVYFNHRVFIYELFDFRLFDSFSWTHILWGLLVINLAIHLFPNKLITQAGRKQFAKFYQPTANPPERLKLLESTRQQNIRAWYIMAIWLLAHAIIAFLYLAGLVGRAELFLLFAFYFMADLICLLIFCPFQTFGFKNKCCIDCRIFNWGHFLMYTPLAIIGSFFSWSLFFLSLAVLIRWEITYTRYPERFFATSNASLACKGCLEQICRIKKPLSHQLFSNYSKNCQQK